MSDLQQIATGDLDIVNNEIPLVDGADEVKQRLTQRLRTVMGEWFLDFTIGVPYYQHIFKKAPDENTIGAVLKKEILETLGVIELQSFELDLDSTRNMTLTFTVRAFDGELITLTEVLT